jgi:hypothetical protein
VSAGDAGMTKDEALQVLSEAIASGKVISATWVQYHPNGEDKLFRVVVGNKDAAKQLALNLIRYQPEAFDVEVRNELAAALGIPPPRSGFH